MKRTLAAIGMTLGLLVGGLAVSAPAQAIAGPTVRVYGGHTYVKVIKTNGVVVYAGLGDSVTNAFKFCPPSISYRLSITSPTGNVQVKNPGECHVPGLTGIYEAAAWRY